jgi:hypothetical protein
MIQQFHLENIIIIILCRFFNVIYIKKMNVNRELTELSEVLDVCRTAINNYIELIQQKFNVLDSKIRNNIIEIIDRNNQNNNVHLTLNIIIQFILNNMNNIYPVFNTDRKTNNKYPIAYYLSSEKDSLETIRPTYVLPEIIEMICLNSTDIELCNNDTLKKIILLFYENNIIIPHDSIGDIYSSSEIGYDLSQKFNINNPTDTIIKLRRGNMKITTQIEFNIVVQHMRTLCDSVFTEFCNTDEKFMYDLIQIHNSFTTNVLNDLRNLNYNLDNKYHPFLLKGGNVLKLMQREYLNEHNTLSDFDFGITIPKSKFSNNDKKELYQSFFTTNNLDVDKYESIIYRTRDELYRFINDLWQIMYNRLLELVNNDILINKGDIILNTLSNFGFDSDITFESKNTTHTRVFTNCDSKTRRSNLMFSGIKNSSEFKDMLLYHKTYISNTVSTNPNSPVRVVDVEVFFRNTFNNINVVNGFDVIRLSLNYCMHMHFGGGIILKHNTKSELLDYSMIKPYTLGHAMPSYGYTTVPFNYNNLYTLIIHSYKLQYFIDDIIRMFDAKPRQAKHDKRINRILIACKILNIIDNNSRQLHVLNSNRFNELYNYLIRSNVIGYSVETYKIIGKLMLDSDNKICNIGSTSNCVESQNIADVLAIFRNLNIPINDINVYDTTFNKLNDIKIDIKDANNIIDNYNRTHDNEPDIPEFQGGMSISKPTVKKLMCILVAFFAVFILILFYKDFLRTSTRNFLSSLTDPISEVVNTPDSEASALSA